MALTFNKPTIKTDTQNITLTNTDVLINPTLPLINMNESRVGMFVLHVSNAITAMICSPLGAEEIDRLGGVQKASDVLYDRLRAQYIKKLQEEKLL